MPRLFIVKTGWVLEVKGCLKFVLVLEIIKRSEHGQTERKSEIIIVWYITEN